MATITSPFEIRDSKFFGKLAIAALLHCYYTRELHQAVRVLYARDGRRYSKVTKMFLNENKCM